METVTVGELIKILEKYPSDLKVFYSTRYALTSFDLSVVNDKYLIFEMSDEFKELLSDDY